MSLTASQIDKLIFHSNTPIDKVVASGSVSINNDGDTNGSYGAAKIVNSNISNPHTGRCFVRARWSIDGGTNYNTPTSRLIYTYTQNTSGEFNDTQERYNLKAAISVGVSSSQVKFVTANGYHGDVDTVVHPDFSTTDTYTPIPLTFIIEYVLFEA